MMTLRDVADVRLGTQLRSSYKEGVARPYLRAANVQRGFLNLADVKTMFVSVEQANRLELRGQDLLFVEGNSLEEVGRAAVWPGGEPTIIQNALIRARLTTDRLNSDFVALWFNSALGNEYVRQHATTTSGSLWHIGAGKLAGAPIPIPPLDVQRRLVDEHAKIMDLARDADVSLDAEKRAAWERFTGEVVRLEDPSIQGGLVQFVRFADLDRWDGAASSKSLESRWPVPALRDVSEIRLGVQVPRKNSIPSGPVRPYLRAANIQRGFVDTSDVKNMGVSKKQAEALELRAGDLLFVEGSGSPKEVGRCATWDGATSGVIHQNSVIRARLVADFLDPQFVATWFNSPAGNAYIRQHATTTSGLYHIGAGKLAGAPVPQPPLDVQRRLVQDLKMDLEAAAEHSVRAAELREKARSLIPAELLH
ncbi:hypothetical protein [Micromonospora arborensis]|uniref:restriction endonuclease subunit S n=1 Tax=Micromonospora arborensis TaxID=2116518 RepID=UPI0011B7EC71|nr:hypothetical protein [Micromonospora arborensis]